MFVYHTYTYTHTHTHDTHTRYTHTHTHTQHTHTTHVSAGMNSMHVGSELLQGYFPFSWKEQSDSHLNMLAANLIGVSIWLLISFYWYWIGFFVKM